MPKTIEITVYLFNELNEDAKDRARDWWRRVGVYDWYEQVYDDASQVGLKITGFDMDRNDIDIEFVESANETRRLIEKNHGKECDTYLEAVEFSKASMFVKEDDYEGHDEVRADFLKGLGMAYLKSLREQYDYEMSDEAADENIEANEYTFTADGKRFG